MDRNVHFYCSIELGSMSANKRVDPSTALLLGPLSVLWAVVFVTEIGLYLYLEAKVNEVCGFLKLNYKNDQLWHKAISNQVFLLPPTPPHANFHVSFVALFYLMKGNSRSVFSALFWFFLRPKETAENDLRNKTNQDISSVNHQPLPCSFNKHQQSSLSQDPTVVVLIEVLFRCHALDVLMDQGECD